MTPPPGSWSNSKTQRPVSSPRVTTLMASSLNRAFLTASPGKLAMTRLARRSVSPTPRRAVRGASCTWLTFAVERSIRGQIYNENGTLGKDEYSYDKLGRLVTARETPTGAVAPPRNYKLIPTRTERK